MPQFLVHKSGIWPKKALDILLLCYIFLFHVLSPVSYLFYLLIFTITLQTQYMTAIFIALL